MAVSGPANSKKEKAKIEKLGLVPKYRQSCNLLTILHIMWIGGPAIGVFLPLQMFFKHILPFLTFYIYKSKVVKEVGRPMIPDYVVTFVRYFLARGTPAAGRHILFGRNTVYTLVYMLPQWAKYKKWVSYYMEDGLTGRWIAEPGTERKDDDVVILYAHGGGFVIDTAGFCQLFWAQLLKELHEKRGLKVSIYQIDYELAPDFQYPSQPIEYAASYCHIVNKLGVDPKKIIVSGDSAGAQMTATFLLHLARQAPEITVPERFGPLPGRPGGAFLMSPFLKLISDSHSTERNADFDFIEPRSAAMFGLNYIGALKPKSSYMMSFSPIHWFSSPHETPKSYIQHDVFAHMSEAEEGKAKQTIKQALTHAYSNPGDLKDTAWWREALPDKTFVVWGGKEILSDDIGSWCRLVEEAGVPIQRLKKEHGIHDWILFEPSIPWLKNNKGKGPDTKSGYGAEQTANFIEGFVKAYREGKAEAAPAPAPEAAEVEKTE